MLILDEPTRGIDVGAKYEIYCIIAELAKQGKSIIMISSEMSELIGMSDRVMVMCDGRVTGFIDGKDATQDRALGNQAPGHAQGDEETDGGVADETVEVAEGEEVVNRKAHDDTHNHQQDHNGVILDNLPDFLRYSLIFHIRFPPVTRSTRTG